jgi:hypothetical protein
VVKEDVVAVVEEKPDLKKKLAAAKAAKAAKAKEDPMEVEEAYVDTFQATANDGFADPWDWKGKKYMRNCHNDIWERTDDDDYGTWVGRYVPEKNVIVPSEEPEFQ